MAGTSTILFDVVDALIAGFKELLEPDVAQVIDGLGIDVNDPGSFVMVGVDDPSSDTGRTAHVEQTVATMGTGRSRDELGEVVCAICVLRGDQDGQAARADVKQLVGLIADWLRGDDLQTAIPRIRMVQFGPSQDLMSDQDPDNGLLLTYVFRVGYAARI